MTNNNEIERGKACVGKAEERQRETKEGHERDLSVYVSVCTYV
jgi:hypothetical protein